MSNPLVTISFIHFSTLTWFSTKKYVEPFLQSLAQQTYTNVEIFCVDNGSEDLSPLEYVKKYPHITIIQLPENIGMVAHNEAIRRANGTYVWCPTLDTIYDPTFLEVLVKNAERLPDGASFGGTVLSMHPTKEGMYTYDTTGIEGHPNHHFKERDTGNAVELPIEHRDPEPVFGISGASLLYRMNAIEDIMDDQKNFIDPAFFMYKEDIDVAYRFLWAGWKNYYISDALGYHVRTGKERIRTRIDVLTAALNRKGKADYVQRLSLRNHLFLLYKNFSFSYPFPIVVRTLLYECIKFFGLLFVGPKLYPMYIEAWKKRKDLQKVEKRVSPQDVAKYFTTH